MTGAERREPVFDLDFPEDLVHWIRTDRQRALRILELVEPTVGEPFEGVGKPEALRGGLARRWSRRIDREHRLVYQVSADRVYFLAGRYHY